jgi:DNA modification methylase
MMIRDTDLQTPTEPGMNYIPCYRLPFLSLYQIDVLEGFKNIPNKSQDLIIADPPYYKAINESWDKQWKTEAEYLDWCKLWFNECVRVLKDTGSFYCYGNFDILSKQKVLIFDNKLNFRQNITLNKGLKSIAGRTSDKLRMFPTASEQLVYYVVQNDYDDRQLLIEPMIKIRNYLNNERKKAGLTLDEMCRFLGLNDKGHGGIASHWCSSKQPAMIPEKHYLKLQTTGFFNADYSDLLLKMQIVKETHKELRYNFNLPYATTDVWDFTPDKVRYGHPTQKPQDICQRIIKASSNENDNVLIPFAGSGSEMVGCKELKRNCVAFEIESKYIDIIKQRTNDAGTLF